MKNIFILLSALFYYLSTQAQATEVWGTNFKGGDDNQGKIIKITSTGTVSQAHGFPSAFPGKGDAFLKPLSYNGFLYILSSTGGKYGSGVLVKYNPITNITTRLFDFNQTNGYNPSGCNLVVYNNKFYGMTQSGGVNDKGVIYEFDPATNIYTKKFDFTAALGQPSVSRFEELNNKLYTFTAIGGGINFGTLIEYDPVTNIVTKKLDATNDGAIGRGCLTGMTAFNGKLYGAMRFLNNAMTGCIFEYDPLTNIYTKKIILSSTSARDFDGKFILAGSVFYAFCNQGDGQFGQGAIMQYDPTGNTLTTKTQFNFSTGAGCFGEPVLFNGKYYGCNTAGGTNSVGNFFEWDPNTNTITANKPAGGALGNEPQSSFEVINNKLYATCTTSSASLGYKSTIVEWDVAANTIVRKFIFGSGDGTFIKTKLLYLNNKVYGVTPSGGDNANGILFSKDVNTGVYTQLYQFPSVDFNGSGVSPLSVYNNKLYGVTVQGGATTSGSGFIFEYDLATSTFSKKINLDNTTGNRVIGQMYLHTDNNFYGITQAGGSSGTGTIFKWNPATNVYTVLTTAPAQGATGGFVAAGNKLYVPVLFGGSGYVYAFDISTATGVQAASYSGLGPASGEFTLVGGILYSSNGSGIVKFDPSTNTISFATTFNTSVGFDGNGMLALNNNELYGFCSNGGANGVGIVYKYNVASNIITKLDDIESQGGTKLDKGNGFVTVQTNATLPIKLTYFSAKENNGSSNLNWATSFELNNKGFNVQHSTDAVSFSSIGFVHSKGNNSLTSNYNFKHYNPSIGKNYYRLQQIDIDGKITYSKIEMVEIKKSKGLISFYPNPVSEMINIKSNEKITLIELVDLSGRIIQSFASPQKKLDVRMLTNGIYILNIELASGEKVKEKIMVKR